MTPKLDPLLGLHFRNVLGDALCAERGLARRLSRVTRRSSRHRVRPELVHVLRGPSGATVHSRVGRGDDIARSTDLLRPAGHGSVRSRHAGRAADLGAMGRQHHRGARRSREREAVLVAVGGAFAPAALFAATHPSRTTALVVLERLRGCGLAPYSIRDEAQAAMVRHVGHREDPTSDKSGHAVERRDPGNVGSNGTPGGQPRDRSLS